MSDIATNLIKIADASRREDGSDIPLGEQCREAAAEIERLRAALEEIASPSTVAGTHEQDRDKKLQSVARAALNPKPTPETPREPVER